MHTATHYSILKQNVLVLQNMVHELVCLETICPSISLSNYKIQINLVAAHAETTECFVYFSAEKLPEGEGLKHE